MPEIIREIRKVIDVNISEPIGTCQNYHYKYDGYEVVTSDQVIRILIDNYASCCEVFGCIVSEDNFTEFLGSDLLEIVRVDTGLNSHVVEETSNLDEGDAIFINLVTSKGVLQFAAYNAHNGYYGHEAVVISKQLRVREGLQRGSQLWEILEMNVPVLNVRANFSDSDSGVYLYPLNPLLPWGISGLDINLGGIIEIRRC